MKKKYIIQFSIYSFIILAVTIHFLINRRYSKQRFNDFYNSNIIGKLRYIKELKGSEIISVFGDEKEYEITLYPSEFNSDKIFRYFAKKGDSITKPSNSDTLFLYKNDKVYKYTFKH